jgi:hypothetical protein
VRRRLPSRLSWAGSARTHDAWRLCHAYGAQSPTHRRVGAPPLAGAPGPSAAQQRGRPRAHAAPRTPSPLYQSGWSDRRGALAKNGPKYLRWALMIAAATALQDVVHEPRAVHRLDHRAYPASAVAQLDQPDQTGQRVGIGRHRPHRDPLAITAQQAVIRPPCDSNPNRRATLSRGLLRLALWMTRQRLPTTREAPPSSHSMPRPRDAASAARTTYARGQRPELVPPPTRTLPSGPEICASVL